MRVVVKIGGIVLTLVLLGGIMAYLAGFFETKISIDSGSVEPSEADGWVHTVVVTKEPVVEEVAGTTRAKIETVISPLITATISSISVRSGDKVKRGDVLLKLDSRELEARVDQAHQAVIAAQATLAKGEKDFERLQRIFKSDPGAVSKAQLDQTQAVLRTAQADLLRTRRREDEAKTALSYSTILAPISGRVVERYADPGDTAQQGVPLLRMYDPVTLRLEANVRESLASKLEKGQSLTVRVDALDTQLAAVVDEIVPSADPGSRTFLVRVTLTDESRLYPGMFGRLLIPIGQREKIYIPVDAVTHVGQLHFVMVKTKEGPVRRYVRLGARTRDDRVEVISGLAPGEDIKVGDVGRN
ncbi:MAG: efflux RND transporter periplasmic adaptor subunit [Proteobacteria bacterium]|nr:efflux RND transporter periplasmic adaptor subunit [Pseudomonadota bacterium]NIS68775.1 efflux RND transporter periplasmic adaptor subunit [Pseudomonadota bacterium]